MIIIVRMGRIKHFIFGLLILMYSSCSSEDPIEIVDLDNQPQIISFSFKKENNPTLESDIECNIEGNNISVFVPQLKTDSLVPTFEGYYKYIIVGDEEQTSGISCHNFNNTIHYEVFSYDGEKTVYNVEILGYNGVPIIEIETENSKEINSIDDYVNGLITIKNSPRNGVIVDSIQIRGRGNATWTDYPKKPYKFKFKNKQSPFNFPENKDWVLLAEYCDKSLLRTAWMCEVSKALEIDYTVNYQHVELFVNNEYKGTYLLTDQVEKGKNRVNIEDDGFLIEDDARYEREPLYFTSESFKYNYTFKYPKATKGKIVVGDENYVFIQKYINNLEQSLKLISEGSQTYRDYIDAESFAKWFVAMEFTGNLEPNLFYVLPSRSAKLKIMPVWDAEWSLGLAAQGNPDNPWGWYFPPSEPKRDVEIWSQKKYFEYLMKDEYFKGLVNEEWNRFKNFIPEINKKLDSLSSTLIYTQTDNFSKWPILNEYVGAGLIALGSWQAEVDYINNFIGFRSQWFNSYVNNGDEY